MDGMKRLILGVSHSPQVVAACRAALLYVLPIGAGALIVWISTNHDPRWAWLVGLVPLIRVLEGAVLDQLQKPTQNDVYPHPPAGQGTPPAVPPA
jgi:hypothetical protein